MKRQMYNNHTSSRADGLFFAETSPTRMAES